MATVSSTRERLGCNMPGYLVKHVDAEAELLGLSLAGFVRRVIKWHRGAAPGRPPGLPERKIPARIRKDSNVPKQMLLDLADVVHLDSLCKASGLPRNGVVVLLLFQWFGIEYPPPAKGS